MVPGGNRLISTRSRSATQGIAITNVRSLKHCSVGLAFINCCFCDELTPCGGIHCIFDALSATLEGRRKGLLADQSTDCGITISCLGRKDGMCLWVLSTKLSILADKNSMTHIFLVKSATEH
jgi:hypothetical protein